MKKIFYFIIILNFAVFAQTEFLINQKQDSTQRDPVIAKDSNGNYAVVFSSINNDNLDQKEDVYISFFNSSDNNLSETVVNNIIAGNQEKPSIAMNGAGKSIVVWSSFTNEENYYDIKGRIYNGNSPAGNEFLINTFLLNTQSNPAAAIRGNGDFIIVWDSWNQDGGDRGVFGQRFNADGTKAGNEFQVNTTTDFSQAKPKVQYFSDGSFAVIWESYLEETGDKKSSGYGMYGRIFNSGGTPKTGELHINSYTDDYQWFGDLAVFNDDSFVVVWCSWEQDGEDGGIYYKKFDKNGNPLTGDVLVNRSTAQYQWLPKVKTISGHKFAVVWSSWKQDGSREGIYSAFFGEDGNRYTFEIQLNDYTESFQWEPDFVVTAENEILAVWASWNQFGKDYDIIGKRFSPVLPEGMIKTSADIHTAGNSTTKVFVHVIDSTALNGHTYTVSFDSISNTNNVYAKIKDETSNQTIIDAFPITKVKNVQHLTPVFDGVALEFIPDFDLALNTDASFFANHSGSGVIFNISEANAGQKLLAPIDIALVWGSTDTLANGEYSAPLDTALASNGQRNIIVPFTAWDVTDNIKLQTLVAEKPNTKNLKWDVNEDIVFLTPPPYRQNNFNTHASLFSSFAGSNISLPSVGDTNYIFTTRPISAEDKYSFTTDAANLVTSIANGNLNPNDFMLYQNYPNPFNPETTIKYTIPRNGRAVIKIFNVLGERISTLLDEEKTAGTYRITLNAASFASGVYLYTVEFENKRIVKKMLLLK